MWMVCLYVSVRGYPCSSPGRSPIVPQRDDVTCHHRGVVCRHTVPCLAYASISHWIEHMTSRRSGGRAAWQRHGSQSSSDARRVAARAAHLHAGESSWTFGRRFGQLIDCQLELMGHMLIERPFHNQRGCLVSFACEAHGSKQDLVAFTGSAGTEIVPYRPKF